MKRFLKTRNLTIALLTIGGIFALLLFWTCIDYYMFRGHQEEITKHEVIKLTRNTAKQLDSILSIIRVEADGIANSLTDKTITHEQALFAIMSLLKKHDDLYGGTVTYQPYGFQPNRKLYSSYYVKQDKRIVYSQLDTIYDYQKSEWFEVPIRKKSGYWSKPYFCEAGTNLLVTYSAVFYKNNKPAGVITFDISIDKIRSILEQLDLGPSGFPALTNREGYYLYHPLSEYVTKIRTIQNVAKETKDNDRLRIAQIAAATGSGIIDHVSTTTNKSSWLVYEVLPSCGWVLQNTFIKEDIPFNVKGITSRLYHILIILVFFLLCLIGLGFRLFKPGEVRGWLFSSCFVITMIFGVAGAWYIHLHYFTLINSDGHLISSRGSVTEIMRQYRDSCKVNHLQPPVFIPTGIYLMKVKFISPNDIQLIGYLWQKYSLADHGRFKRGITFPMAEIKSLKEVQRTVDEDTETIRWYFNVEVREKLNYNLYPIDQGTIRLGVQHCDLNHNIVLIPDTDAYTILTPSLLPGLENGLFIPGWKLINSYFSMIRKINFTDFGVRETVSKEKFPYLVFNLSIQRDFINAFISNLTPLIIVSIMLFALLVIVKMTEIGRLISIIVGMFFVIVFSHIGTRNGIAAQQIFYIEYFYFTIDILMLMVSLNAILAHRKTEIKFITYQNNLISKLIYWPFLTLMLFLITIIMLY
jgi:hypothetical protein